MNTEQTSKNIFKYSKYLHLVLLALTIMILNRKKCLSGAVTLTKNAVIDKYGYSGYGIGFDRRSSFSFPGGWFGQNMLISGLDMSFSAHIDNKKKDILVFGKGPT